MTKQQIRLFSPDLRPHIRTLHSDFFFFFSRKSKEEDEVEENKFCMCLQDLFYEVRTEGGETDQRYVSIKKMRKEIWNGIISEICAMCIHYGEWTFECAIFKARAHGLVAFLSPPTPCSRQLARLAVRRSCALSLAPLLPPPPLPLLSPLSLSPSLCFSAPPFED